MAEDKSSLRDVINYKPEEYLTERDIALIQKSITPAVLTVLRKVLIPTISDPDLPIEDYGKDFFLEGIQWGTLSKEEIVPRAIARELSLKFIVGGLIKLKIISSMKKETPQEAEARKGKDSTK